MSTVEEIAEAIAALPQDEFWKLTDKLMEIREEVWDKEIEADSAAGRLDVLWQEADKEITSGETVASDESLRHPKLSD